MRRARFAPEPLSPGVEALLERRASRLRTPERAEVEEQLVFVAEFGLGDERYALHLEQLRVALPLKLVTPVPLAPPHVVGIFSFQGQTLCVHSLAALLGVRGWRVDPAVVLVVEPAPSRLVALDCEHVPETRTISLAALTDARAKARTPILSIERAAGQLRLVDDLLTLLQPGNRSRAD